MCGIVAVVPFAGAFGVPELSAHADSMAGEIRHRGPDAAGVWVDAAARAALAHRRLSIVDLSPTGAQPMVSATGRYVIAFNGEIYNFNDLRAILSPRDWRGHSDTEVLLAAIEAWGVDGALRRCVGMFAFALWDAAEAQVILARDRLGEKPLYYGRAGDALLVASELKSFSAWPGWRGEIDRLALDDFMRHGCVHAPHTIFSNVRKLLPGHVLRVRAADAPNVLALPTDPYWSLEQAVRESAPARDDREAVDELERLLAASVRRQMVADVPVGAFLSGGIDSSTIVAIMQTVASRPVRTFSIGFEERAYNEAHHAKAVSAHLGTDHTELYVSAAQARDVIPLLPRMFDEPFADSSQIPTYLVARLARRSVTVSLSGDGGDELFGGYNRYFWADRIWGRMARVPPFLRQIGGAALRALPPSTWDRIWRLLPAALQMAQPGDKVHKLAEVAAARYGREAYASLISQYRGRESLVQGLVGRAEIGGHGLWGGEGRSLPEDMMLADALSYLPDDILVKVDRATMAVSLEARAPFLDHQVVEFAFRLPQHQKMRDGVGKWLLRQVLQRHVPASLFDRPKMGFGLPIDAWLRGPLKEWAASLLDPIRLRREGFLNPDPIASSWREHQSGRRNLQHFLWNALMFQAWLESGPRR